MSEVAVAPTRDITLGPPAHATDTGREGCTPDYRKKRTTDTEEYSAGTDVLRAVENARRHFQRRDPRHQVWSHCPMFASLLLLDAPRLGCESQAHAPMLTTGRRGRAAERLTTRGGTCCITDAHLVTA